MAQQRPIGVVRERDIARGAIHDVAAVAAEHDGREAAAVEIQDRLLALRDGPLEREAERP